MSERHHRYRSDDHDYRGPVRSSRRDFSIKFEPYQSGRRRYERDQSDYEPPVERDLNKKWEHDLSDAQDQDEDIDIPHPSSFSSRRKRNDEIQLGTALEVENLSYEIDEEELKEMFQKIGEVYSASIKYDRSGRSEEMATVVMKRKAEAEEAISQLDGKSLKSKVLRVFLRPDYEQRDRFDGDDDRHYGRKHRDRDRDRDRDRYRDRRDRDHDRDDHRDIVFEREITNHKRRD